MKFAYASGSRPLEGYTIKRGIGVGGFGEVYFAVSDAGKELALKRIQRNLDIELRGVSQCLNLKHVNLIALFDIRYDDHGQAWVVMEYVTGESLNDVIDRNPNGLPVAEVMHWFRGIAHGVVYLHDHGIVHRDLKPGNIFTDEDVVKIGDYGLSKFISCSRRSGQTESVGTFHYMAPEIGKGVYGKEIDIYALGVILYEMLTGKVPFEGESSQEIIMKHLTADPELAGVAQPFREVIARALAKDPDRRFRNVGEMLAALETAHQSSSVAAQRDEEPLVIDDDEPAQKSAERETLFITEGDHEIHLGPVKEIVNAQPVGPHGHRPQQNAQGPGRNAAQAAAYAGASAAMNAPGMADEPIARAVQTGWSRTVDWWNHGNLGTPVKVVLLVVAALLLVLNASWIVPVAVVAGLVYLVYFGIRGAVISYHGSGSSQHLQSTAARSGSRSGRLRTRAQFTRAALINKPHSERLAELTGSMLVSAVICAVLSLVMMVIGWKTSGGAMNSWSSTDVGTLFAWMMITCTGATWTVLAISKFWEGTTGEQVRRRFVMLVAGLALGALAWGAGDLMLIDGDQVQLFATSELSDSIAGGDKSFPIWAYLAFFAGLFVILRWWRQADPLRPTRLGLWSTAGVVLAAVILGQLWQFPQPWGYMIAGVTSIAVQLSAPWISPKEQARIKQEYQQV